MHRRRVPCVRPCNCLEPELCARPSWSTFDIDTWSGTVAMPHKPLSQFSILSSAAGSAQIAVSSQSGDCSVGDEFQSTHLRLTRLVNSELTAACMHGPVTAGCDDLQNGRGSQYCGARILAPSGNAWLWVLGTESRMGAQDSEFDLRLFIRHSND